ncbi:hypothetical protein [Sphingomonas albertensis]|uniref:Uncharacterized protein n=1 Tax=Sphingomonas albertensis TaxID=2762591 RepID=A0ABR7AKE5_9SPHN|nr:hypothetical protein [Sphingomonas albertensis]MBC3940924.1 hypothetical protein [Sphingomonas albertensis]
MSVALFHDIGVGLFVASGATAAGAIANSLIPQWPRIVRLALGEIELPLQVSDGISHPSTNGSRHQRIQKQGHS